MTERAELAQASEESWQSWVEQRMARASVVIIDGTVSSAGLSWELDLALKRMDAARIVLLAQKGAAGAAPPGVWRLDYEAGAAGEKLARKRLDERLRSILLDRQGTVPLSPYATAGR